MELFSIADGVACIVPARSGSTRIPDKNLAEINGETLLHHAISTARTAFGCVLVSTDSDHYASLARDAGAWVPALRPEALASNEATMDAVVHHAVTQWIPPTCDVVVVVQPTSPFTIPEDLHRVADALRKTPGAVSALTATRLPSHCAFALIETDAGLATPAIQQLYDKRSQDLPALWAPSGNAFATWADRMRAVESLISAPIAVVAVPAERALDIDEPSDLEMARTQRSIP
jgi:CMP-N,N'-diacetyllegionaminic acid synthase